MLLAVVGAAEVCLNDEEKMSVAWEEGHTRRLTVTESSNPVEYQSMGFNGNVCATNAGCSYTVPTVTSATGAITI